MQRCFRRLLLQSSMFCTCRGRTPSHVAFLSYRGIKQIGLMLQRAGLCDRLAQDLQLHLPASLSFVQAAEKKLQELQASVKQSEDAEAQVSGLKKELEQVQATLQASKDAAKAADTEKVGEEIRPWN